MCISVSKVQKTLENKGFFLDTDKKIMCIYVYHLYQMCISSGSASSSSFCGSRINLYTVNIQYTNRPLKAFIYKKKYSEMCMGK